MRYLMMMCGLIVALTVLGCGSDGGGADAILESCNVFCEKNAECNSTLADSYESECKAACDAGDYNDADLGLSNALLSCSKYEEGCTEFSQCVSGGGSLTDDEYGQDGL